MRRFQFASVSFMRWLIALAFLSAGAGAEEPWKAYGQKGPIRVERRPVPGSKFNEHRALVTTPANPELVERAIWSGVTEALPKTVKKRTVLKKTDDEFVVYDELTTPVVSDRDATIRIRRLPSSPSGQR